MGEMFESRKAFLEPLKSHQRDPSLFGPTSGFSQAFFLRQAVILRRESTLPRGTWGKLFSLL